MKALWGPDARRRFLFCTIGAVIPSALLALFAQSWEAIWSFFIYSFVFSQVIGSVSYAAIPKLWPWYEGFQPPWNWVARLTVLLLLALVGTLMACAILMILGQIQPGSFWRDYLADVRIAALITVVVGTIVTAYETTKSQLEQTTLQLRTKELENERALKLATEARLTSLESRIHPHFLFNTLNSISALIREDPERAERLIERMAALLRFSLDSEHTRLVPLERELKIVTDYLEIEQARFGQRLRYQIDVGPALNEALVPPLSVQTLVENSVKYAIATSRTGGEIRITSAVPDGFLRVTVSDSGPGFDLSSVPLGHGIDNLRGRLSALFGGAAQLVNEASAVSLLIPRSGAR